MNKTYKVGLVGTGYWSDYHLKSWTKAKKTEIAALCNRSPEKLYNRAEQFHISRENCYRSIEEMLEKADIDIVDIVTTTDTHVELVEKAVGAGKHVMCQKPFAHSVEDGEKMVNAAKKAGVRFMVMDNWVFLEPFPTIKNMIDNGTIGKVNSVRYSHKSYFTPLITPDVVPPQPYFRKEPRLIFTEMGSHWFFTFLYLFGKPRSITAETARVSPYIKAEDNGVVIMRYDDFIAIMDASWATRENTVRPVTDKQIGNNWTEHMVIDGEKLSLKFNGLGQYKQYNGLFTSVGNEGQEMVVQSLRFDQYEANYRTIEHFINCLENNTTFVSSGEVYLDVLRIIDAVYRSASQHTRIDL